MFIIKFNYKRLILNNLVEVLKKKKKKYIYVYKVKSNFKINYRKYMTYI